jgi:large subunit ribosomal protein L31
MKAEIHPEYVECHVHCGCGNSFTTRATVAKLAVEICSSCHPFYTGKQKFVDAAGRVEKFQQRFAWKDDTIGSVLGDAQKARGEQRKQLQDEEAKKRQKTLEKKKKTEERRAKILEDKKSKYAEAEAAKKAAEEAKAAAAAEAEAKKAAAAAEKPAEGA